VAPLNRSVESRMRRIQLVMVCCVIGAVGLVVEVAENVGYFRGYFRLLALFSLLGDVWVFFFCFWLPRRLKTGINPATACIVSEKVCRKKPLDFSGRNSRPELVRSTAAPTGLTDQRARPEIWFR
jgi:hypothetical protein